jgi:hypothetical protein
MRLLEEMIEVTSSPLAKGGFSFLPIVPNDDNLLLS